MYFVITWHNGATLDRRSEVITAVCCIFDNNKLYYGAHTVGHSRPRSK